MARPRRDLRTLIRREGIPGLGRILALTGVLAACGAPGSSETAGPCRARLIDMTEVTPDEYSLQRGYRGIGMDHEKRVYAAISTGAELRGEPGDVLLFQYDTRTGDRRFLKSVRQVLEDEGNLGPNPHWPKDESVAKVHSDIFEHNGRLYFSTHDWHTVDAFENHRGGHFLSFDPATGRFHDLSKDEPRGISVVGQGIIAMNILRREHKLVGWTFPYGEVLIHDLRTGTTTRYESGLEPDRITYVARVVLATKTGKVFGAYGRDSMVEGSGRLYELARSAGRLEPTGQRFSRAGRLEGLAEASDGRTIYLADWDAELYAFDSERERLEHLGSIYPEDEVAAGEAVGHLYNLALSPDDRKIFTIPRATKRGRGGFHVYEYDIESGARTDLGDCTLLLKGSTPMGNGVFDDQGRYYLSYSREDGDRAGILQIDVGDRLTPTAAAPAIDPYGGSFSDSVVVSLVSRTPAAGIHYTLDGTDPGPESAEYAAPITLRESGVLKARVFAAGLTKSPPARATFLRTNRPPETHDSE